MANKICAYCAAEYDEMLPECPYCGSTNYKGAEAEYYEAAFHHHMYTEAGDTVRAEKYKALMDIAEGQMGELAFVTDKIDEKLALQ